MLTKSIHGYGRCVNVTVDGNKIQMYWYPLMEMAKLGHTCKIDSLPYSPSKKTGKNLAKIFKTLGPTPTTVYSQGEALIRASLMALLTVCTILLWNEGWGKKRTHTEPQGTGSTELDWAMDYLALPH